jgi:hypothetical protein
MAYVIDENRILQGQLRGRRCGSPTTSDDGSLCMGAAGTPNAGRRRDDRHSGHDLAKASAVSGEEMDVREVA